MFFISSGAVEVVLPNERVRLGSGEFVGEMALLSRRRRQADVVSLGYGRALELAAADFQRFLSNYPRAKAEIERTAKARTQAGKGWTPEAACSASACHVRGWVAPARRGFVQTRVALPFWVSV